MTSKNKYLSTILIAVTLTLLLACRQGNSDKTIEQRANLTIDTFTTVPPEIDGCSCYFSKDSLEFNKGEYVYVNDFAQTSFLTINGVLTKFTQTEFKDVNKTKTLAKAKSDEYEMTIEVFDGRQNGDKTSLKTGTIKVKDKNGKTITMTFYGECGC